MASSDKVRTLTVLLASVALGSCEHAWPASSDGGTIGVAITRSDAGADSGPDGSAAVFVAVNQDFAGYRSWTSFQITGGGQNPRTIYYNHAPPHGSQTFPVGTMIVKELVSTTAPAGLEIDAMVQRGGDYNAIDGGAPGWEWFGLALSADGGGPATIQWRGTGAPSTGTYGGGNIGCTGCHAVAVSNDYVQSPQLQLTNF
jgi:hypothetical protein